MRILVVDDDAAIGRSLQIHLACEGHEVRTAASAQECRDALDAAPADLLFLDLNLPDANGLDVLKSLRTMETAPLVVMITGVQDAAATIEAIRRGAFDYIRKPLDLDTILASVAKAVQHAQRQAPPAGIAAAEPAGRHEIVGGDPRIIDLLKQIALVADSAVPVLIQGESGTGKELVARALHDTGRPGKPFVAVNCSAVVATLLESELFGHVRGAFTGATADKRGKLAAAGEGTLFLDEIGDLALDLQAKLLRVLQEREFEPVGGLTPVPFRARVVAATHRNLHAMIEDGAFREDLYYRLAVSTLEAPPLRERMQDLPLLIERLLARIASELHRPPCALDAAAMRRCMAYAWPGNIRELGNVLTRAVLLSRGAVIGEESLALAADGRGAAALEAPAVWTLREVERRHVLRALEHTGWNITRTAELLDISRVTLRKKIEDFRLERSNGDPPAA